MSLLVRFLGILYFSVGFLSSAHSSAIEYKPLTMRVEPQDQFLISGFKGRVNIIANEKSSSITIGIKQINSDRASGEIKELFDEWLFSLQRDENLVELTVRSPQAKQKWAKYLTESEFIPEFEITISAPSRPLKLAWRTGQISLKNWMQLAQVQIQEGRVDIQGGSGGVKVSHQEGQVMVTGYKGSVDIDTYKGKIIAQDTQGPVVIDNFVGESIISNSDGDVALSSFKGSMKVNKGKGRIDFANERGILNISGFSGDVRGRSEQGAVIANLNSSSNVRITTEQGNVSLRLPGSGASVNLGTEDGAFYVPNYLRLTRLPNLKLMRGRLRGKNPGNIYVRTESGSIRVR